MAQKVYSVGIYARLSVAGDDRKRESIETQIEIAKAFVDGQKDMVIAEYYTDIGKSGTNFKREGFERLMQDVRLRRINCIVVKDLSRFGRNYLETGNYIEKLFPFLGVRFIAVTDRFDSMYLSGQNEILSMNLKNLVNEMYARDIAVKVKSGKQAKREQGGYAGGIAPYGYKMAWLGERKCLLPEEATSDIVKKLFTLFLSGRSMRELICWLYEERIVRPLEHHRTGDVYAKNGMELKEWTAGTLKRMLGNPVYAGCLVSADCAQDEVLHLGKHTHEAIVEEGVFLEALQRLRAPSCRFYGNIHAESVTTETDIFDTVLFCGKCHAKMRRSFVVKKSSDNGKRRSYRYYCPNAKHMAEESCATKGITLHALTGLVKAAIYKELLLAGVQVSALQESNKKAVEAVKAEWNQRLREGERKKEQITRRESEQYAGYCLGKIELVTFQRLQWENEQKRSSYRQKQAAIEKMLLKIEQEAAEKNHIVEDLFRDGEEGGLSAEVVRALLDRIEIYPQRRVKIMFAFKREYVFFSEGEEACGNVSACHVYPSVEGR